MTSRDREYILWLSKRLINKYKEDPKIYDNVVAILDKDQKQLAFYQQTHSYIDKYISASIDNLDQIRSSYKLSIVDTNKQYSSQTTIKTNEMFENLDLNTIFSKS